MSSGVAHGAMECRRCWKAAEMMQCVGNFKLVHDPGHWGARTPKTLVLGVSKGNTQSSAYAQGDFDEVGFKGNRRRLLEILQSIGLLSHEGITQFERRFTASESEFAFASIVRCSLTGFDVKKNVYAADSCNVLPAFLSSSDGYEWAANCVDQHLTDLPAQTKLVLLLGNQNSYIKNLKRIIANKRGPVTPINEVAYCSKGVKFIHLTQASGVNGHLRNFIRGEGTSGHKRNLAKAALAMPV